jgi:hypothetical protein
MEPEGSFRVHNSLSMVPVLRLISRIHTLSHSILLSYTLILQASLHLGLPIGLFVPAFSQAKLCVHTGTKNLVGVLWTSDQPDAEIST